MPRFSVFHIIKLDNYAASGIAQANSKSYGVLQCPTVYFSELFVGAIYTKLSHSREFTNNWIAEGLFG